MCCNAKSQWKLVIYHLQVFIVSGWMNSGHYNILIIYTERLIIMPCCHIQIITHIKIIRIKSPFRRHAAGLWHLCQQKWNTALTFTTLKLVLCNSEHKHTKKTTTVQQHCKLHVCSRLTCSKQAGVRAADRAVERYFILFCWEKNLTSCRRCWF